ncbi:hypothetical protein NL529_30255, partial [Klebsiella pneumoniae]|nr:hypothetical protein [Klebsiella pneumoniae]
VNQPAGPPSGGGSDPAPPVCTGNRCTARTFRSTYVSGYFGAYDPATIPLWPERMGVILGEADSQGPLVADAKRAAAAAGNRDARFV